MEPQPLLSIIIPVYNSESFLRTCLDSVLRQTFSNFEAILVNDGSTDGSPGILREYVRKDRRFLLLEEENLGVSEARNRGLRAARGLCVGFVDSDDWIEPDMYSELYRKLEESRADVAMSPYDLVFPSTGRTIQCESKRFEDLLAASEGTLKNAEDLLFDHGSVCNKLYLKEFLSRNGLEFNPGIKMGEDALFCWMTLTAAEKMVFVPRVFYHYRKENHSSASSGHGESIMTMIGVYDEINRFIREKGKPELQPWINHLEISFPCFCYAKLEKTLKPRFFQEIRKMIAAHDFSAKAIAYPPLDGTFSYNARYAVLRILHPLALFAVHRKSRFLFDGIVRIRETLAAIPEMLAKFSAGRKGKNGSY